MDGLDIIQYTGEGYKPMVDFESWRVAFLRYAERFDRANIHRLERHMMTDEVFVLLEGEASLLIGENAQEISLEKNKLYNVKKAVWHGVIVSKDALLLIVENANTGLDNTEYMGIVYPHG